jgi:hypothetical protein
MTLNPFRYLISLLALFFFTPTYAKDTVYTVTVNVDVTRPSAVQAKEDAFVIAREQAFLKLLKHLSLGDEAQALKEFSKEHIEDYVKSFSVKNEHHSHVQYKASLTFEFDAKKIQTVLEDRAIAFTEIETLRLVVLPILLKDGVFVLWDDMGDNTENLWYKSWLGLTESQEDVHITCPLGDLEDQTLCPLQDLSSLKKSMLFALKERYGTEDVLLTILSLDKEATEEGRPLTYKASIRYLPFALHDLKDAHTLGPFSFNDETAETVLEEWRTKLLKELGEKWKFSHTKRPQTNRVFKFKVMAHTLDEWRQSLKKIQSLSVVKEVTIHSLARGKTVLWVSFKGDLPALKEKLIHEGFKVDAGEGLMVLSLEKGYQ